MSQNRLPDGLMLALGGLAVKWLGLREQAQDRAPLTRQRWRRGMAIAISLLLSVALVTLPVAPARATIRQLEEAPEQVVYQSRYTLKDQYGNRWQAIAFNRIRPDGTRHVYLRLVGFPGAVAIDRTQPLQLTNPLGTTLTAADASNKIFTDTTNPEPHVGQYDLQPLLGSLQAELPLQLTLPTQDDDPVRLAIASPVIAEWLDIAQRS